VAYPLDGPWIQTPYSPARGLVAVPTELSRLLNSLILLKLGRKKSKVFTLHARTGRWGSARLRLPDFHDFPHYEGGKVVTPTHQPSFSPRSILVLIFRG
jgi:hypothetical protein